MYKWVPTNFKLWLGVNPSGRESRNTPSHTVLRKPGEAPALSIIDFANPGAAPDDDEFWSLRLARAGAFRFEVARKRIAP